MIENNPTNVQAAFEMLLEEIEAEIDFINGVGSKAFEKRDYDRARDALEHAGIHTLFDADLLRIDPDSLRITVDPSLADTEYWALHRRLLRQRHDGSRPSREYLRKRWAQFRDSNKAK
jgi:hypothetical protein